jgi:threonine dehydrogenase-like Zn-dependent dehydrogenase
MYRSGAAWRGGTISVHGVYAGFIHGFLFGDVFEKSIGFRTGQTHVQRFMPELLQRIEAGELKPETIISHRLPLAQAADGYRMFDRKEDNCRKVVLRP